MEQENITRQVSLSAVENDSQVKPAEQVIETQNLIRRINSEIPVLRDGSAMANLIRSVLGLKDCEGLPINLTVYESVLILESAVRAQERYIEKRIKQVRRSLI